MESFNGKLRDELLNLEVFDTLWEAKVLAERWRREYNQRRPHSALAYRPPAPEARLPRSQALDPIPWSAASKDPGFNLVGGATREGRSRPSVLLLSWCFDCRVLSLSRKSGPLR